MPANAPDAPDWNMAKLQSNTRIVDLGPNATIGRGDTCTLRLDEPHVSLLHAVVRWTTDGWELRDLGSRNGTWVDEHRLHGGQARGFTVGSSLRFAGGSQWRVVDVTPPPPWLEASDGSRIEEVRAGALRIPASGAPLGWVLRDRDFHWWLEDESGARTVANGDTFEVAEVTYTLHVPHQTDQTTEMSDSPTRLQLHFEVTSDEEHIQATLSDGARVVRLEPRVHWALLLDLARAWLEQTGAQPWDRGWVDDETLRRRLRMGAKTMSTQIHRARAQLADAGIPGAELMIERRNVTNQLRLNIGRVTIEQAPALSARAESDR